MSCPWLIYCPPGVDPGKLSSAQLSIIMAALPGEHGVVLLPDDGTIKDLLLSKGWGITDDPIAIDPVEAA
jgi:hypothetical protein